MPSLITPEEHRGDSPEMARSEDQMCQCQKMYELPYKNSKIITNDISTTPKHYPFYLHRAMLDTMS